MVVGDHAHLVVLAISTATPKGAILLNERVVEMRPHSASPTIRRLARTARVPRRVTPHALRRSYISTGPLMASSCATSEDYGAATPPVAATAQ